MESWNSIADVLHKSIKVAGLEEAPEICQYLPSESDLSG